MSPRSCPGRVAAAGMLPGGALGGQRWLEGSAECLGRGGTQLAHEQGPPFLEGMVHEFCVCTEGRSW